jgi:DHA1 family multidrug resistance protein-like MFS transporter
VRFIVLSAVPAGLASYLLSSFLPLYIKEFEARMVIVSLFFSLQGIFNMIFSAVAGWQVDKHDRAVLQSVFTFLFAGGVIIISVAYGNPYILVAGLVIVSLSSNIIKTARYSLIVDFIPSEKRSSLFGFLNGVGNVFSVAGGIIGGYLLLKADFTVLFFLIAGLVVVSGVLRVCIKDPRHKKESSPNASEPIFKFFSDFKNAYHAVFSHRILTLLIVGDIFIALAFSTTFNFYGIYFKDVLHFKYDAVGLLISVFYIGIATASFAGSVLSDKIGHRKALTGSVLVNACFIFAFIQARTFFQVSIIYFVLGMTGGVYAPNFFTILGDYSPEEHRGKIYSIQSINDSIFLIVAPVLGGLLWDTISPLSAWYVDLAGTIVAGSIFLGLLTYTPEKGNEENEKVKKDEKGKANNHEKRGHHE